MTTYLDKLLELYDIKRKQFRFLLASVLIGTTLFFFLIFFPFMTLIGNNLACLNSQQGDQVCNKIEEESELKERFSEITSYWGKIPISTPEIVSLFPVGVAGFFTILVAELHSLFRLRPAISQEMQSLNNSFDVTLIAPLLIDPKMHFIDQITGILILLFPFILVLYSIILMLTSPGYNQSIRLEALIGQLPYSQNLAFYRLIYGISISLMVYSLIRIGFSFFYFNCIKAQDIIRQYAEGRRDFRNLSLRGESFRGENLSGADFSGSDLRGTNFRGAILKGTIFRQVKAGLQKRSIVILTLISWLVLIFFGFLSLFGTFCIIGYVLDDLMYGGFIDIATVLGIIVILLLIFISISIIHKRLKVGLVFSLAVIINLIISIIMAVFSFENEPLILLSIHLMGILTLLCSYLGWLCLKSDPKNKWVFQPIISFVSIGGTSFYGADLVEADFSKATLKSTDFRETNLIRTCWRKAKKLNLVRPGKTLLADPAVRNLMVTGKGESQSYERGNLRGANLKGVNLNYANLKFADLSEATLEEADLEYANLTEVNVVKTDFTRAKMTGVCLEGWNIESNTKLDEVDCQFVYMLEHPKPETNDRERHPNKGIFQTGEFSKLFSKNSS
ncbi:MAG: pentapeptide repeat-containing protein [Crocosphaera sp.]